MRAPVAPTGWPSEMPEPLTLSRCGDRALNRALHTIAATRMRSCPTTQAYVARRTAEGKNPREIRRFLKRYIARQLYRTLPPP